MDAEAARTKGTPSSVVTAALSQYLGMPVHTLFQVSISGALVAGVYDREVSVKSILEHGDCGLGTFANLDGEMVVLDGRVYQVQGTGRVSEAAPDAGAPFAVVTRFSPQTDVEMEPVASFKDLEGRCDWNTKFGQYLLRGPLGRALHTCPHSGCESATARHAPRRRGQGPERIQFQRHRRHADRPVVARLLKRLQHLRLPLPLPFE